MMFSNRDLRNLIFPLFVEQFLLMLVGIADTFTVSFASEADVSGVSLVNSFNTVLVFVFTALSSGGAVIISQYVGRGDGRRAERSAGQLLMISVLISAALTALILAFHSQLLILLFGRVEAQVMAASRSYLLITTCSIPALAVYDVGAALCRSIGKAGATMYISTAANLVNIIGNCVGVFVLHLGLQSLLSGQKLQIPDNGSQRCPQIVGYIGDQFIFGALRFTFLIHQAADILRHLLGDFAEGFRRRLQALLLLVLSLIGHLGVVQALFPDADDLSDSNSG